MNINRVRSPGLIEVTWTYFVAIKDRICAYLLNRVRTADQTAGLLVTLFLEVCITSLLDLRIMIIV